MSVIEPNEAGAHLVDVGVVGKGEGGKELKLRWIVFGLSRLPVKAPRFFIVDHQHVCDTANPYVRREPLAWDFLPGDCHLLLEQLLARPC